MERKDFYSGKTAAKSTIATNAARLVKCAETLRLAVEHGVCKLKRKTLLAVIDHIIHTLPGPDDDGFVQPLLQDYIKTLVSLLGHAPNVELLATKDGEGWHSCVDFTLQVISHYVQSGENDSGPSRASPAPGTTRAASSGPSTFSSTASSTQRSGSRVYRSQVQDLLQCLVSLTHASNAPLLERVAEISPAILQILQLRSWGVSQLHQLAFSVINALLMATQADDTVQANSLAADTIPLIGYWWQARSASEDDALLNRVRMEMLNVVYNSHLHLEALVKQGNDTSILGHIENLSDVLWFEYSRREDRAQLQQDDLVYPGTSRESSIFSLRTFSLRTFNVEAEKKWAVVQTLALLEGLLWRSSSPAVLSIEDERPRKRHRTTTNSSRLRQKLRSLDSTMQHAALQLVPYFITYVEIDTDEALELLPIVISLTSHKNNKLANWALIACAR